MRRTRRPRKARTRRAKTASRGEKTVCSRPAFAVSRRQRRKQALPFAPAFAQQGRRVFLFAAISEADEDALIAGQFDVLQEAPQKRPAQRREPVYAGKREREEPPEVVASANVHLFVEQNQFDILLGAVRGQDDLWLDDAIHCGRRDALRAIGAIMQARRSPAGAEGGNVRDGQRQKKAPGSRRARRRRLRGTRLLSLLTYRRLGSRRPPL